MKNKTQNEITLPEAKKILIQDVMEVMKIEPGKGFAQGVEMFINAMWQEGIYTMSQLTETSLVLFRSFLRNHWCSEIEVPVAAVTGSLLAMGASRGFIDKELYLYWQTIEESKDFDRIVNSKKEEL